jgi:signal transduction histidine kinase
VADRIKIVRVVQNLLTNAVKFSPRGGKITIRARTQDGRIMIRVVDEGPGVPQELLSPLFDKGLATARKESEDAGDGFGLGLKVVREFVRLHGGRFWIEPTCPRARNSASPCRKLNPDPHDHHFGFAILDFGL